MSLKLGKSFDRSYKLRLPFLNGYYNIEVFLNKKSTFLLFGVDSDTKYDSQAMQINMFKNLESSKFCETFIDLHNYRSSTLDILNQYKAISSDYFHEVSFLLNETINLSKVEIDENKSVFDCLNIYGFTMNNYYNEFIFLITERHNIIKKLNKKIVRTSGIQIASNQSLKFLNEYHQDHLNSGKEGVKKNIFSSNEISKFIRYMRDENGSKS